MRVTAASVPLIPGPKVYHVELVFQYHIPESLARIWGYHISALSPTPDLIGQGGDGGNPLSVYSLNTPVTWEWLARILNRCQRHHCSTGYCLRVNKKAAEAT